jgi:tRNA A-37 threonylcarbamoyl transferase component Bud32
MTSGDRWQRVGALFNRAVAAPEAERLSLIRASDETHDIQDEVIGLLQSHDDSGGFLEPPSLLEPGATVGAYRIERVLGRGGMGVVYLATDTRLQRLVALKSLPPHLFRDDQMHARLRREARAAAALSHPAIATVYALEEIGDHIFIATEYLEGRTLRDEMRGAPMEESRVLYIARAIAAALTSAHDRGIVHRDLKPENVMLTPGGVKIVDFGLAQFDVAAQDLASVSRLTDAGVMAGTPPYMAPEQLLGQPTDARTDQFAFGVLLYEMLTGRHPFASGRLPSTIAKTLAANPERANVSDRLWAVIDRATQKAPADRFASMQELAGAFDPGTVAAPAAAATRDAGLSWWSRHQLIVALAYWFMVWPAWHVHSWTGRYGVLTFLATLAVVVIGANTRLHLWFSARTYPHQLTTQRSSVRLLVRIADVVFSVQMIAIGLTLASDHTGWSALFISFGLGAVVAFLVIEPATERAAFESRPR